MNNDYIFRWARMLAKEIGGEAMLDDDVVYIKPNSQKWKQLIGDQDVLVLSSSPDNMQAWRTRIQYVEKMAAQAILAGPICYSCTFIEPGHEVKKDILRLAFGFSLSAGSSCRQRYTAYYVFNEDLTFYTKGTDCLFENNIRLDSLDLKDKNLKSGLQNLLNFIPNIESEYKNAPAVQKQLSKIGEEFSVELRDLERFYSPSYGRYVTVLGNPPEGVRGNDTVEVEYSNRMEDVIEKYRAFVLFEPLSVGIIHCRAHLSKKGDEIEISLPFINRSMMEILFQNMKDFS